MQRLRNGEFTKAAKEMSARKITQSQLANALQADGMRDAKGWLSAVLANTSPDEQSSFESEDGGDSDYSSST